MAVIPMEHYRKTKYGATDFNKVRAVVDEDVAFNIRDWEKTFGREFQFFGFAYAPETEIEESIGVPIYEGRDIDMEHVLVSLCVWLRSYFQIEGFSQADKDKFMMMFNALMEGIDEPES